MMILSKSNYMQYLRHPAWLWLEKHDKSKLPEIDDDTQAMFDAGNLFEEYAEQLWPAGTTLGYTTNGSFDWNKYKTLPARTQQALDEGTPLLFQGRLEIDGLTCIFDVLERNKNGSYNLYEIKSSTSAKTEHEYDLAFQTHVLTKAGLTIEKIYVVHVDKTYVRKGDIDVAKLTATTEVTDAVTVLLPLTAREVEKAKQVMSATTMPDPSPARARLGSFSEWLAIYRTLTPHLPAHSIYDLARANAQLMTAFEEQGIALLTDIPTDYDLTPKQRHQIEAVQSGTQIVHTKEIRTFLDACTYPLYFLDYETLSGVIPAYDGTRPYQQVPFQYSLHILTEPGGTLTHKEYLHTENSLPIQALVASLQSTIGAEGSVIVWHKSFEQKRNEEMAELLSEHREFLLQLNERVVDLMVPFAEDWLVDKDFKGSASIKAVLPVLVPELSYKTLAIQAGNTAQRTWMQCVLDGKIDTTEEKVMHDLREYCKFDTLAMVKIWEVLQRLTA